MDKKDFIKRALYKPNDYIAYYVARELAELYPGKAILEGHTGYFDLEEFVRAGKCAIVEQGSVFSHVRTLWNGPRQDPKQRLLNSWLNVLWRGQLMEVVLLSWAERCYFSRHHWIIADNHKDAEAFFAEVCEWSSEMPGEVLVFEDGEWEKDEELYNAIKSSTFDNLILGDSLKRNIQGEFEQFFKSREVYERHGVPWKRGFLFFGPPGNGKTHTVKALANHLGQPCLYVKALKSEDETEQQNIANVFERARVPESCLLIFEDLDSMIHEDNRSSFLNELDGFGNNSGIVVVATTNHPDRLDPALLDRPGRFDRKYFFNLPAVPERLAYVELWNQEFQPELRLSEEASERIVEQTEGFSFAYLKELFVSSMMQWRADAGRSIDELVLAETVRLRRQMPEEPPADEAVERRGLFARLWKSSNGNNRAE